MVTIEGSLEWINLLLPSYILSSEPKNTVPNTSTSSDTTTKPSHLPPHSDIASNTLSPGAIAGIVVGVIFGLLITIVAFTCLLRWRRRRRKPFIQIQQISYPVATDLPARRRDLLVRSGFMDRYPQFSFRQDAPQVSRPRSGALAYFGNDHIRNASAEENQRPARASRTRRVLTVLRDGVSHRFSSTRNDSYIQSQRNTPRRSVARSSRDDHESNGRRAGVVAERVSRNLTRDRLTDYRPSFSVAVDSTRRASLSSISSWGSSQYDTNSLATDMSNDILRMSRRTFFTISF